MSTPDRPRTPSAPPSPRTAAASPDHAADPGSDGAAGDGETAGAAELFPVLERLARSRRGRKVPYVQQL
jgi:hypothetical protein